MLKLYMLSLPGDEGTVLVVTEFSGLLTSGDMVDMFEQVSKDTKEKKIVWVSFTRGAVASPSPMNLKQVLRGFMDSKPEDVDIYAVLHNSMVSWLTNFITNLAGIEVTVVQSVPVVHSMLAELGYDIDIDHFWDADRSDLSYQYTYGK